MVVSRSRTFAPGNGVLILGSAELQEAKSQRILGVALDSKFERSCVIHLTEVVSKQAGTCESCTEQESYLIVHVCSRAVSMCIFCPAWSIVPPYGFRRRNLICVCWIVLFAVRKGSVRVSFVAYGTEGRLAPCVCSISLITEWTTL